MEAFKLLKSRTKLFIRVRYKVSFYFPNINPTSTLPLICCPPDKSGPQCSHLQSGWGPGRGLGWMVSTASRSWRSLLGPLSLCSLLPVSLHPAHFALDQTLPPAHTFSEQLRWQGGGKRLLIIVSPCARPCPAHTVQLRL